MTSIYQVKKEISAIAKDAIIDFFQPIAYAFKALNQTLRFEDEKRLLIQQNNSNKNIIRVMQKAVCFNQGRYLEYTFITAEKHRYLKDAYRENKNDIANIAQLTKELTDYINTKFYENAYENFQILHAYFKGRKGADPRICIKGNFRADNKSTVVTVFRDSLVNYDSNAEVDMNIGFLSVYKTGTYFLENNIPKAAAAGRYFNPRLNQSCVKKYLSSKKSEDIAEWDDCWIGDKSNKSSFYKSTMIIPMTLWNNKVSDEFKKLINMSNVDRTIFGFLCFDHDEIDYFREEDVSVGYIFADILSMYVFTRLIYMEISKTFMEAENWLEKCQNLLEPKMLSSIWKDMPAILDPEELLGIKIKKTKVNDLFPIDSDLLKFVESLKIHTNK